ncbi:UDP-3-O-N-acetylglucosamine deacetylase [Podospora australis]|uniref:UDP-3-O-N-acetylglucosamine deacetylase n=1 Tax=Podospora australis TaxID=1536484 RepID=A0AAN7AFJ4_9PEZI|nr:UDP-3-O-N-acetylglucosamine deacetylase [Podospora australis]
MAASLTHRLSCALAQAGNIRAIFLFKDVMKSNTTAIKTSGFNTLIMFGVGILANGDIMYYSNTPGSKDVLIASKGSYVGGDALAEKVRSFKNASRVNRLEVSMNSQNVRNLMNNPGPNENSPLYQNFKALKEAWTLDAVNNDDESLYDVASTINFGKMLGRIGYKYTIAPYTNQRFWISLRQQLNPSGQEPLLDRAYLQCYDGGAYNDPAAWQNTLGMKVVPLIWVTNDSKPSYGQSAAQARSRFAGWQARGQLAGGGYWNDYDIEKMGLSYREYGLVLANLFP